MKIPETHAEYLKLARELEQSDKQSFLNLGILSSFTADFLKPFIIIESTNIESPLMPWFGPFGQFEQMVMDTSSALWQSKPHLLWLALRIEDVDRYLVYAYNSVNPDEFRKRIAVIRKRLVNLARKAREKFNGPILISNLTMDEQHTGDLFNSGNSNSISSIISGENKRLVESIDNITDTHIFDYAGIVSLFGASRWKDPRLWYMARVPFGQEAQKRLAKVLCRTAAATLRPSAKCLVLDLDNTLWGGVLGDDGPSGIVIGDDYPGSVFKDFQAALLGLTNRGFLLAIASKNNLDIVKQTLDTHREMILRSQHFADIQANWDPKPVNIERIGNNLNIGLDSLVFIDDNPLERVQVQSALPMVRVVELPPDPLGYKEAVLNSHFLDRPRLLAEDSMRASMYQQEGLRKEFAASVSDVGQFLMELEMEAEVGLINEQSSQRIHQLIHKTNQFNLTTRRHSMVDIERMAESPDSYIAWLRLKDRFGDLGLVCVGIICQIEKSKWEIDTFLMSCRVMGRNVENAFLSYLAELAISRDAKSLRGVYIETAKNVPVKNFYQEKKFTEINHKDENAQAFEIDLTPNPFKWPDHIKRVDSL